MGRVLFYSALYFEFFGKKCDFVFKLFLKFCVIHFERYQFLQGLFFTYMARFFFNPFSENHPEIESKYITLKRIAALKCTATVCKKSSRN